ncbi:FecR domain-containing protein [Sphingomonas sanguinis]|uniref:FecR family protein n=1 Tax=Sphingomonas sp. LC-1 TaxID=3110957 RepID=UPI0021BA402A|nr:FecR domain-containing protein [Sphingomonas sp. LC-1]MCT8003148.1 FecR domain-containing protein [Sphingomonas sp. LC-1]
MPEDDDSAAKHADAEALEWIVAFQESPDNADLRVRFEQWYDAAPLNAAAWQEAAQVYASIGETRPVHIARWEKLAERRAPTLAPPIAAVRNKQHVRVGASGSKGKGRRRLVTVALPAAAAAIIVVMVAPELALRWQADALAGTAEPREIDLADGSHASLSPGSAFSIDYSKKERRVTLLRGKAWFEVRHESGRPFRVDARSIRTTDIGTAFEVGMTDDAIHIAVQQGTVRVDDLTKARALSDRLVAGRSLSIGREGQTQQQVEAPALIGAWRDGQLAVQDRPMREVIEALRPWYVGMIVVRSDALVQRHVTGVYDLRNPVGAMEALTKAYGGQVIRITPWLLVLAES